MENPKKRRTRGAEPLELRLLMAAEPIRLGTFGVMESIPIVSAGEATAAVLGDFNRDGLQDMAFGSSHRRDFLSDKNSVVGIALGDGIGGFRLGSDQKVHDDIVSIVAADLNRDGYDDLVAGGIFRLSVFLSEVDEVGAWLGLSEPTYLGGTAEKLVVADLNGDGSLDIASAATDQWLDNPMGDPPHPTFANRDITGVPVYAGDGKGNFVAAARLPGRERLVAIDYDDDGDLDLITGSLESNALWSVLMNESNRNIAFRLGATVDTIPIQDVDRYHVDINGDEYPDRIETSYGDDYGTFYTYDQTLYRLGRADGTFDRPVQLAEIFAGNWRQFGLGVSLASAAPSFVFDVDGNGFNDFVHMGGTVIRIVRQGNLEGYAAVALNYRSTSDRLHDSVLVDITGDGLLDVIATENSSVVTGRYVQEGRPDGSFGESYFLTEEQIQSRFSRYGYIEYYCCVAMVQGDFNHDGVWDRIQQTRFGGTTWRVSLQAATGDFKAVQDIELSDNGVWLIGVDDINGDSHLDVLIAEPIPESIHRRRSAMRGDGTGHFLPPEVYVGPYRPDTYHEEGGVSVTIHEDSSLFDSWAVPQVAKFQLPIPNQSGVKEGSGGPNHQAARVDVDHDGDLDVVVAHGSGVAVVLAVGPGDIDEDGRRTWGDISIFAENFGRTDAAPHQGDINRDRRVDFEDFLLFSQGFA